MQWNTLLKQTGFKKVGSLYRNPVTGRTNTQKTALNNAASLLGYNDYNAAKEAFKSKAYKRFSKFAANDGIHPSDRTFNELFAKAWKDRNKKTKSGSPIASQNLTRLLKYVDKLPRQFRNGYRDPL